MFTESIDLLWGAIAIAVIAISGFLCYLLLHLAHLTREGKRTVEDVNHKLKRIDPALDAITTALQELSTTITSLRQGILDPIARIGTAVKSIRSIGSLFGNRSSDANE